MKFIRWIFSRLTASYRRFWVWIDVRCYFCGHGRRLETGNDLILFRWLTSIEGRRMRCSKCGMQHIGITNHKRK